MPAHPADLCTVEDVRQALELDTHQPEPLIQALITAASHTIIRDPEYGREYAPKVTEARQFEVRGRLVSFGQQDLRAAAAVILNPGGSDEQTLDPGDYRLEPVGGALGGTYRALRLARAPAATGGWWPVIQVTGDWGMEAVPEEVRRACVVTVASWMDRAAGEYAGVDLTPGGFVPQRPTGYALPAAARRLLDGYRTPSAW